MYCLPFRETAKLEWQEICQDFVDAARQICPELLQKMMVHLLLHLVDCMVDFAPFSAFNTEMYKYCSLYLYNIMSSLKFVDTVHVHVHTHALIPNSCRCESFNSILRTYNIYANRGAPSRDIANSFAVMDHNAVHMQWWYS